MTYKEIDEMIRTVDKNGDGKINYSEFRVMMGAPPLLIPATTLSKFARSAIIITITITIIIIIIILRSATALTQLTSSGLFGHGGHVTAADKY